MRLTPSLFAHIQNDAFLKGSFQLQGGQFINSVRYLNEYFKILEDSGIPISPRYQQLSKDLKYLAAIEEKIRKQGIVHQDIINIATRINEDLSTLKENESLFLPGGWENPNGGHALIYQWTRTAQAYRFTVINSGSGLEYHAKKSSATKELFSPTKSWSVPLPQTPHEKKEIQYFIQRLLQANVSRALDQDNKPMNETTLYHSVLPSIAYINGVESADDEQIPDYFWTAGQRSGTCTQRSIHQMLKINSESLEEYQVFIFRFKHHALMDYAQQCINEQSVSLSVSQQINLAMDNNLKILKNIKSKCLDKKMYLAEIQKLKARLERLSPLEEKAPIEREINNEVATQITLKVNPNIYLPKESKQSDYEIVLFNPVDLNLGSDLLNNLEATINKILQFNDPASRYVALEQLILSLPINPYGSTLNQHAFYRELDTLESCQQFQNQIHSILNLLNGLKATWLKEAETASFYILVLSVLMLQIEIRSLIAKKNDTPSFGPISHYVLNSIIQKHRKDPFWATTDPLLDERLLELQQRKDLRCSNTDGRYAEFLKSLVKTEEKSDHELKQQYQSKFGSKTDKMHRYIQEQQLESIFMIALLMKKQFWVQAVTDHHLSPLLEKIREQMVYESEFSAAIDIFYMASTKSDPILRFSNEGDLLTPFSIMQYGNNKLATKITQYKYPLAKESSVYKALAQDMLCDYNEYRDTPEKTANAIQLEFAHSPYVTQHQMIARDYYHLRSHFSIPITLAYFTRNTHKLAGAENQKYLEANLFQPGLLLTALHDPEFIAQLNGLLQTGLEYATQHSKGQHTPQSLYFLRINYLVSRFMVLCRHPEGLERLLAIEKEILKHLSHPNSFEVTYLLHHYLFLTLCAQVEAEIEFTHRFIIAFNSYCILQAQTNPHLFEDAAHLIELECISAKFQIRMNQQPEALIKRALSFVLQQNPETSALDIKGSYPIYNLVNQQNQIIYEFNVILGQLFKNKSTYCGLPLVLKHHPMMRRLGLNDIQQCFMSSDGTYISFNKNQHEVLCIYENNKLQSVQKTWTIEGVSYRYELQSLSHPHKALYDISSSPSVYGNLPNPLQDRSMDFWHNTEHNIGLLTQNNIPIYSVNHNQITLLEQGRKTQYTLCLLDGQLRQIFTPFESNEYLVAHRKPGYCKVSLPRYDLHFEMNTESKEASFTLQSTGETIIENLFPIDPKVAGLILAKDEERRYLIPIQRFYASDLRVEDSAPFAIQHDRSRAIATAQLKKGNKQNFLWHDHHTERYRSYPLQNNEPIANNSADALYLAYIYLATHQDEKSWNMLVQCTTLFGGLTGDPDELESILWICKDLPHILDEQLTKAKKETPTVLACQLKALSLLCDFLSQDQEFNLREPNLESNNTDSEYALLRYQSNKEFLVELPQTIYTYYSRFQPMKRHLEHYFKLSLYERQRLLDLYYTSQPLGINPEGALGYEYLRISLKLLEKEQAIIEAKSHLGKQLSASEQGRLDLIKDKLSKLKPVSGSTSLEPISLNLSLSTDALNKIGYWSLDDIALKLQQPRKISTSDIDFINTLGSNIKPENFKQKFQSIVNVLHSNNQAVIKVLEDFCSKTLRAQRHIPLPKQHSCIPVLCNILYRIIHNLETFQRERNKADSTPSLIRTVQNYNIPPLTAYQAKNDFKTILTVPQFKEQKYAPPTPIIIPLLEIPLIQQMSIDIECAELNPELKSHLDDLITRYVNLENESIQQINYLNNTLTECKQEEIADLFSIEEQAGLIQLQLQKNQHSLAEELLQDALLVDALIDAATQAGAKTQIRSQALWVEALNLANKGPADPQSSLVWALERASKDRAQISKAFLLSLYTQNDLNYSIERTGLLPEQIETLQFLVHQALSADIAYESIQQIRHGLKQGRATQKATALSQTLSLLSRPGIPLANEPVSILLQYTQKILLRAPQVRGIKALSQIHKKTDSFSECIEKIIAGGGKSKVLIPILAEKKAQGDNLVVFEVPQSLLATNHVDFNQISQNLYHKKAHQFKFDRNSNCSPERLKRIYTQFTEIMIKKEYLVTTRESIQSLHLKYIELLFSETKNETWEQQLCWVEQIIKLLAHHGDCIMDEVHLILWMKKRLSYVIGEEVPLSTSLIQNAISLFQLIDNHFIQKAPYISISPEEWADFKKELVSKLMTQAQSPLKSFNDKARQYNRQLQEDLFAYLTSTTTKTIPAILHAKPEEKSLLAFLKQEIQIVLPQTLIRRLNRHYGASKQKNLTPVERTLAIPYSDNNVPNEHSRFGHSLESLNLAVLKLKLEGISLELLKEHIVTTQAAAYQELLRNKEYAHVSDTFTAHEFNGHYGHCGFSLDAIDCDHLEQMKTIHSILRFNATLIDKILKEHSLKQITQNTMVISSNAINHADQFRSIQGLSATPQNHPTMHHRLKYNNNTSLGTDGYVTALIQDKNTPVSSVEYLDVSQFIHQALSQSASVEKTRAIIDLQPRFQGVSNKRVVREIATAIQNIPQLHQQNIKQVLYFNKQQILCAIDIHAPQTPIILGTTDTKIINRLLSSTPNERFTYYAQAYTLGTDIAQDQEAHALVLVDEKLPLHTFIQGSLRMRALAQQQTMELICPNHFKTPSLKQLIERFKRNEDQSLLEEMLSATKAQMDNQIHRQCLLAIQNLPLKQSKAKAALAQHFKPFLVQITSFDLFALYGAVHSYQPTFEVLHLYKQQLIAKWQQGFEAAQLAPSAQQIDEMGHTFDQIIEQALPYCPKESYALDHEVQQGLEVEYEHEHQHELELQNELENECSQSKAVEAPETHWSLNDLLYKESFSKKTSLLNTICPLNFSPRLTVSTNHTEVYMGQKEFTGIFSKRVYLVLYRIEDGQVHATIVTPQESEQLKNLIIKTGRDYWLATTDDTLIAGKRPLEVLNDLQYLSLREQIRFFNAEFSSLLTQNAPFLWLKDKGQKIALFKERLAKVRPQCLASLLRLETLLGQNNQPGYDYIRQHPFTDLTQFDWKSLTADLSPVSEYELKKVSQAWIYMNQNYMTQDVSLHQLEKLFKVLPLDSHEHVDEHHSQLMEIRAFVLHLKEQLAQYPLNGSLLININPLWANIFFPISIQDFYAQYPGNVPLADIAALRIIQKYPAFYDKTIFEQCFERIAQEAQSVEIIQALLDNNEPHEALLSSILSHRLCDESVLFSLIRLPQALTKTLLNQAFNHRHFSIVAAQQYLAQQLIMGSKLLDFLTQDLLRIYESNPEIPHLATWLGELLERATEQHPSTELIQKIIHSTYPLSSRVILNLFNSGYHEIPLERMPPALQLISDANEKDLDTLILLEHKYDDDELHVLAQKINQSEQINTLLDHTSMTVATANFLFNKPEFSGTIRYWEWLTQEQANSLLQLSLNKVRCKNPELAIDLFALYGNPLSLGESALQEFIEQASDKELEPLINLPLNRKNLECLAKKIQNSELCDQLLNHPNMTSVIADILFKKPLFSGTFNNWPWLTKEQVLALLDTSCNEHLDQAIEHPLLLEEERISWLRRSRSQHQRMQAQVQSQDPQQKILYALNGLKIKACEHALTAHHNPDYSTVKQTAMQLYHHLYKEVQGHFGPDKITSVQSFKKNCLTLIDAAEPVLKTHRGYKQAALDILNAILYYISFAFLRAPQHNWRFFEAKTDSLKASGRVIEPIRAYCETYQY